MTLSSGTFFCKKCRITFEGDYKPQTRPRKSCPKCHKMSDMAVTNNHGENGKKSPVNSYSSKTSTLSHSSLPNYDNINIKSLLKNWSIHQLYNNSNVAYKAASVLMHPKFIEQGEVKHDIYWTSETPSYSRPEWVYPWQPNAIDYMKDGHCIYIGSRQKVGKTLSAALADIEECIATPGWVITLVAPRRDLAAKLLRQMFKEVISLKKVKRIGDRYEITETGERLNLWKIFAPYIITDNILEKVFKNGSRIQVLTLDYASVQGLAADVIHIEEFDKVVRLTKEGGRSDKIEALAGLFPQIRAKPSAKIRITCNNASGLFRVLRDRLSIFGKYFRIYMEVPHPGEPFAGNHFLYNKDEIYTDENGVPKVPDVDDYLKVLMTALMGDQYYKQQMENVDAFLGELFHPDKVEKAYKKGYRVDQERVIYDYPGMGCDPGGQHATAYTVFGILNSEHVHLHSRNWYAAENWDKRRFDSILEQEAYEEAEAYVKFHCQFIAAESNSGFKKIAPFMGSFVKKLLDGYEYINKKWVHTNKYGQGKSKAKWNIIWSNFGGEKPEGKPVTKMIPKNEFVTVLRFLFDLEMITLQERDEYEQQLRIDISLFDPGLSAEKYKGDQIESALHILYWQSLKNKTFQKIISEYKEARVETW